MNSQLTLSVLVLTYNHIQYIQKALDSILEQETNFDFKIFIYDDASTDGTSDIVREYAAKYPEKVIPIIRKTNIGASKNMYDALCNIKSNYFTILEGDDYWTDKNKLQLQVDMLKAHPDCTICAHKTIYNVIKDSNKVISPKIDKDSYFTIYDAPYVHTSSRLHRNIVDFTKESIDFISFDINLYYKFLSLGNLAVINKVMSVYNITGNGIYSSLSESNKQKDCALAAFKLDQYFDYKYNSVFRSIYIKNVNHEKTIFSFQIPFTKRIIKLVKEKIT